MASKAVSNAAILDALTGLAGRIEAIEDNVLAVQEATKVAMEAATKGASGKGGYRHSGDFVTTIADDHKGHKVGVRMYADSGDIYVSLTWISRGKSKTLNVPVAVYRLLAGNIADIEATLESLAD